MFVAPVDGSGNSRVEPVALENIPPGDHIPSPKDTANGEVVGSDLVVSTERRAPEGQDNDLEGEFHNDSKTAALGTLGIPCNSLQMSSQISVCCCLNAVCWGNGIYVFNKCGGSVSTLWCIIRHLYTSIFLFQPSWRLLG